MGNGNPAGTAGDCPRGFVCLENGNCGGILDMEKIFLSLLFDMKYPNICYEYVITLFVLF